jgi:cytidine deaminase
MLKQLADDEPQRHDLFIGLVGPLGSSRPQVIDAMRSILGGYGYGVERVHLAGFLDSVQPVTAPLPERGQLEYYKRRMDAGDALRRAAGDWSGLAALAVAQVGAHRQARMNAAGRQPPSPVTYVFDSLKHPREAALLKSVYGSAFWLVSIVQDISERTAQLAEELASAAGDFGPASEAQALELITRDEADPDAPHGQHVRDVFASADFFLPVQRGVAWETKVDRFFNGVFGEPFLSPFADEEAMRHAQACRRP